MEEERRRSCTRVEDCQSGRVSPHPWDTCILAHGRSTVSQRPSFAFQVDRAVEASSSKPIAFLQTSTDSLEDSESWLEVAPDELDGMLTRAFGQTSAGGEGKKVEVGDEHGKALGDLAQKVEEFVGGQGDAQGARFVE